MTLNAGCIHTPTFTPPCLQHSSHIAFTRPPFTLQVLLYFKVDDPLDSTAVHVCAGLVGTLMNGAFAKPEYINALLGAQCGGFIYSPQGGRQLAMQILGESALSRRR